METDEEIRKRIRAALIDLRVQNDLTQTEVGKIVGKSKNAVASWEQGLSLPDVSTLYRLALFYNKPISYLYGLDDENQ